MIAYIIGIAIAILLSIYVEWEEAKEFKAKHGFSRRDFRHYRKMMQDSSYRGKQKKSPANAELINRPLNLN